MDEWAPEERLEESMGHLLPEVREMAEVRAAFNEVLLRLAKAYREQATAAAERGNGKHAWPETSFWVAPAVCLLCSTDISSEM